jgi:hypothetical protein
VPRDAPMVSNITIDAVAEELAVLLTLPGDTHIVTMSALGRVVDPSDVFVFGGAWATWHGGLLGNTDRNGHVCFILYAL